MMLRIALSHGSRHANRILLVKENIRAMSSSLPYHLVVGMPALSPTMESGTLSAWKVEEGAEFAAGDSLAEIETDKASIDFEAQDDGFVAKYLIEPGVEVAVGKPIMVTVEEEDQVAAFKDFTLADVAGDDDPVAAVEEKESPVVAEAAPPAPEPVKEVKVEAPPPPVAVAPTPPPPAPVAIEEMPSSVESSGIAWDPLQKMNSPLAKSLALAQSEYHDLYGPTGHKPLVMEE